MIDLIYTPFVPPEKEKPNSFKESMFFDPISLDLGPGAVLKSSYEPKFLKQDDIKIETKDEQKDELITSEPKEQSDIKPITISNPNNSYIFPQSNNQNTIYNPITTNGNHAFTKENMDVGNMKNFLDEAAKYGIYFRVTSGKRNGATTKSGNKSWHSLGEAIDVTPIGNQTYKELFNQMKNTPLIDWMKKNGYGILDETDPEMLAKTGGTGKHWHIGKDKLAIKGLDNMLNI